MICTVFSASAVAAAVACGGAAVEVKSTASLKAAPLCLTSSKQRYLFVVKAKRSKVAAVVVVEL